MKKTLYIDIDCIAKNEHDKVSTPSPVAFEQGVFQYLSRISNDHEYSLVLCVPQDADKSFTDEVVRICKGQGMLFEDTPGPTELAYRLLYKKDEVRLLISSMQKVDSKSFQSCIIYSAGDKSSLPPGLNWAGIHNMLSTNQRQATVIRKTSETDIQCFINLDGTGQHDISTGLGFFDHMLQQIARHGNMDLTVKVQGDLHIDEHHTIEDVGLALGATFNEALGSKKGIERYGFLLPMDDCLAQVAIDFGGRAWLVWAVDFHREKVGDMPTEMFHHFFKSFSDAARCNLNIKAEGSNEHHKIESIFKAFAKSIGMAVKKTNNNSIPSTKGSL